VSETPQSLGETLRQRLGRGPVEPGTALAILEQLLTALGPVHRRGAVHGRITPEGIYLSPDGGATLSGLEAAGTSDDLGTTADGRLPDDPGYMAPEQINGDFVDARADVFALGVIAYEMLIGRNPFWAGEGTQPGTVVYRIVYRPYPEIAPGVIPGLAEGVRAVVAAAMAKDPHARFADAPSFLEALVGANSSLEGALPAVVVAAAARSSEHRHFGDAFADWAFEARRSWGPYFVAASIVIVGLIVVLVVFLYRTQATGATEATAVASSVSTSTTSATLPMAVVNVGATSTTAVSTTTTSTTVPASTTSSVTTTTVQAKLAASVTLSGLSSTYSGSPIRASAKTNPEGLKVNIAYSQAGNPVTSPINAGSYEVTATIDDPQYEGTATGTLAIAKRNPTINVVGWSGSYTGGAHRASGTASGAKGENLTALLRFTDSYTNVPGGTAHWTFSGNNNYNSASGSVPIVIRKANASISVAGWNHAYDGGSHGATLTSAKGVGGENLSSLITMGGQTYTNVPGGPALWSFKGNGNYNSASGSVSIVIGKANANIHVSGWSGEYDGYYHGASGSATGVLGENLSGLLNLGANFREIGGHTASWTFAGSNNYKSDSGSVSIVISEPPTTTTTTAPPAP
jgi:serine/threonine protein kinase